MQQILLTSVILLWIVVLLNLLLTLGVIRKLNATSSTQNPSNVNDRLQEGEQAPDFTAETLDGQQVTLATYTNKSVAFHFISTHCQPCREMLPELVELAPLAMQAGVELMLVILDEVSQVRAFVDEFQLSLPVLVAPRASNNFADTYKISGTPSYCLIDGQGQVVSAGHPKMGEGAQLAINWRRQKPRVTNVVTAGRR